MRNRLLPGKYRFCHRQPRFLVLIMFRQIVLVCIVIVRSDLPTNGNVTDLTSCSVNGFVSGIMVCYAALKFFVPAVNIEDAAFIAFVGSFGFDGSFWCLCFRSCLRRCCFFCRSRSCAWLGEEPQPANAAVVKIPDNDKAMMFLNFFIFIFLPPFFFKQMFYNFLPISLSIPIPLQ